MTAGTPSLLICKYCDTVYRRRALAAGEVARCRRCKAELERHTLLGAEPLLALVVTAIIVFVQANVWPIVTLELNGQQVSSTLWGVILAMWRDYSLAVAMLVAGTLFFFPIFRMLLLGWLLWHARRRQRAPGFRAAMVALHYLGPWTMSEVFVLGVLVSIVKVRAYFDVSPDAGIYAYAALMLLITLLSGIDLRRLWHLGEERA
ncbi:MAG: paraquat-inducible protein A [Burkholderiales bacterium]